MNLAGKLLKKIYLNTSKTLFSDAPSQWNLSPCDIFCIIFQLRPNCSYEASVIKQRGKKKPRDFKFETWFNTNKRQVLQNFSVQHCYSIQFALIKASNMADHPLVTTGFSSKSCCRGLELFGSGVKAKLRLSLSSCPPGLFITFWHLVRHKASACLNSGILNEYKTELTKQLEKLRIFMIS